MATTATIDGNRTRRGSSEPDPGSTELTRLRTIGLFGDETDAAGPWLLSSAPTRVAPFQSGVVAIACTNFA